MWLYMRGIYIEVWGLVSDVVIHERYRGLVSDVVIHVRYIYIHERYIYRDMGLSE